MDPNFSQTYAPAEAERGKFVPIDSSTITGYASAGRGKYAVLTYIAGSDAGAINLNLSGVTMTVSALNIDEPVTIDTVQYPVTTFAMVPNTTYIAGSSLTNWSSGVFAFATKVTLIEIFNNDDTNTIYFLPYLTTDFYTLTSSGLPIIAQSYYSIERETQTVTIGVGTSASDIRVFGHCRA